MSRVTDQAIKKLKEDLAKLNKKETSMAKLLDRNTNQIEHRIVALKANLQVQMDEYHAAQTKLIARIYKISPTTIKYAQHLYDEILEICKKYPIFFEQLSKEGIKFKKKEEPKIVKIKIQKVREKIAEPILEKTKDEMQEGITSPQIDDNISAKPVTTYELSQEDQIPNEEENVPEETDGEDTDIPTSPEEPEPKESEPEEPQQDVEEVSPPEQKPIIEASKSEDETVDDAGVMQAEEKDLTTLDQDLKENTPTMPQAQDQESPEAKAENLESEESTADAYEEANDNTSSNNETQTLTISSENEKKLSEDEENDILDKVYDEVQQKLISRQTAHSIESTIGYLKSEDFPYASALDKLTVQSEIGFAAEDFKSEADSVAAEYKDVIDKVMESFNNIILENAKDPNIIKAPTDQEVGNAIQNILKEIGETTDELTFNLLKSACKTEYRLQVEIIHGIIPSLQSGTSSEDIINNLSAVDKDHAIRIKFLVQEIAKIMEIKN